MTAITLDDMKSKLVDINTVFTKLDETEPLSTTLIDKNMPVKFHLEQDWATSLSALQPTDEVGATMTIGVTEQALTKEGITQAAANFGLSQSYIQKVPAHLIEGLLNYHYGNGMGDTAYNVLAVNERVSAFTRPTLTPFSNRQLLERTLAGIHQRHGSDIEVFADYKFQNSLQQTDIRLIVPTQDRVIVDGGMDDMPAGADDVWFAGVHLSNSLIGKKQTTLEAYLFRWWCTNGCTTEMEGVGKWSRRVNGQQDDVYEWAQEQVDEILGGLEYRFDQIQALTRLSTSGNTADILTQIFTEWEVPVSQRDAIRERLIEMEHLTMYTIMQAITQAANESDLADKRRDRLMRIGGAIPTETFDTIKAQVWREGHSAGEQARNPYEVTLIQN